MDELYPFCSELYSEEGEVENDLQSIPLLYKRDRMYQNCPDVWESFAKES